MRRAGSIQPSKQKAIIETAMHDDDETPLRN